MMSVKLLLRLQLSKEERKALSAARRPAADLLCSEKRGEKGRFAVRDHSLSSSRTDGSFMLLSVI